MSVDPHLILQKAFPGMLPAEAESLISTSVVKEFPAGSVICQEGALESTFYIIMEGTVSVSKTINDREIRHLKDLGAGDFFGEMAIIHNAPRSATVQATSPISVLEINKEAFSELLEHSNSVSLAVVRIVSRRLRENDAMAIEDLRVKAGELADAYQQLAEQEYARSQFLTTIAHELRTPLMSANGFLQVIRKGMLQGDALNSGLDSVIHNLQDITSLVNDILFLQEQDLILPEFKPTDPGGVVAAAVEKQRIRAEHSGIGMQVYIASNLPLITADSRSLERALAAVLDNAVKFSPDGGEVRVDVQHEANNVCIQVTDNGVGIPPEALPRVFDRFFHLDEVGGHLFRGAGLGLSIARQVIEQHRGSIQLSSELGKGTRVSIQLPQQ